MSCHFIATFFDLAESFSIHFNAFMTELRAAVLYNTSTTSKVRKESLVASAS